MQLNRTEMRLLKSAIPTQSIPSLFRLPTLHEAVPLRATMATHKTSYSAFGRALVEAGVINAETLPETVVTPKDVVEQGLGQWFTQRISHLQYMRFDVQILDAQHANSHRNEDTSWYETAEFDSFAFGVKGDHCDRRFAEPIAVVVEKKAPGLFLSVFEDLIQASWRTLSIHSPQQVLEQTTCYTLWDCDSSEIPSDKKALPDLIDRYDEEEAKRYLPSVILKTYGEGYCFSPLRRKRKKQRISKRTLDTFVRSPDTQIARLATHYQRFLEARKLVDDLDARMPGTSALGLHEIWATCQILFNDDERCLEFVDQEGQNAFESGEATEFLAFEQLPTQAGELKTYFQKLDAVFQMISQMDALIPLISVPEN